MKNKITAEQLAEIEKARQENKGNTAQKKVPNTAECDIIKSWINR